MKSTTEVLTRAEASVAALESKLTELDTLIHDAQALSESIEAIKNDEADLLASDRTEAQKHKAVLSIRATRDIREANLAKVRANIAATENDAILAGIAADRWICAIDDAVLDARLKRSSLQLVDIFAAGVSESEVKRLAGFSKAVKELDRSRFVWVQNKRDQSLFNCRQMREVFNQLRALAEAEPELEIVAGDW